jgi:hypothetical protein
MKKTFLQYMEAVGEGNLHSVFKMVSRCVWNCDDALNRVSGNNDPEYLKSQLRHCHEWLAAAADMIAKNVPMESPEPKTYPISPPEKFGVGGDY